MYFAVINESPPDKIKIENKIDKLASPKKTLTRAECHFSPCKRRMTFDDSENNYCSPVKKRNTSGKSSLPLGMAAPKIKMPLSPRQDNVQRQVPKFPLSPIQRKPPSMAMASPRRMRALNFSPVNKSDSCITPEISYTRTASKVRALNFSPIKSPSPLKVCNLPSTPSKFTALRGCESPVKSMHSPHRGGGLLSPHRQLQSVCLSPIKRIVQISPMKNLSPIKLTKFNTPRKDAFNSPLRLSRQEGVCYQKAKQALHTAMPDRLLCREKEYKEVNDFLSNHLSKNTPGSLYISGAPGTGKTAVLSKTLNRLQVMLKSYRPTNTANRSRFYPI